MLLGVADVDERGGGTDPGIADHHDVGVGREGIDVGRKHRVPHLHAPELRLRLAAAELELFDNIGDFLEPVRVEGPRPARGRAGGGGVADDQKRGSLEQHDLVGVADRAEGVQMRTQRFDVGNQVGHDAAPRPVQRLVPDGRAEALQRPDAPAVVLHEAAPVGEDGVALLRRHQVHLVDEHEDARVRGVLLDGLQHAGVVVEVLLGLVALDVEHVDQDLDRPEDGLAVPLEVGLVEGVLAAAVPEVQDEVPQKTHVVVLHVERGGEAHGVAREEVGEDDGAHGRLARVGLAHQQDFLFLPWR
eukprot:CAMPEP_0194269030 /NCGR_PEP_ID=MMETSP0169-20130528/3263_1 /TAXON_ID=218684 /ORGANISM="Corethron pennatum, Strain L29A3" /LENGTH=301 /DNA_ID=CAMNT_0039010521 /DNA_START=125 /DNA_END=1026 /DNA_ORIENTATION=+